MMDTCPKCHGEMWDNRNKKTNPKAPDFKCKDKACDGVIWPARDNRPQQVSEYRENISATQPVARQPDWDAIAEGKVRHGLVIAFIEKGAIYSKETCEEIERWQDYILSGVFKP